MTRVRLAIELRPLTLAAANEAIRKWHRHHKPVIGHLFSIGAYAGEELLGVAVVGRPSAPELQKHGAYELTRLATPEKAVPHVASRLIAACWRAARAMGVKRMISYTREDEPGTCYRAAGWRLVAKVNGREWAGNNKPGRWLPGLYLPSTEIIDRVRWEVCAP